MGEFSIFNDDYKGFVASLWEPQCKHCENADYCHAFYGKNWTLINNYAHCSERISDAKFWGPSPSYSLAEEYLNAHPDEFTQKEYDEAKANIAIMKTRKAS